MCNLAATLRQNRRGHLQFALLGLALGELRVHRATTGLGRNHGIHQADAAADRLRARYSALAPAQGTL
jgi:hypothetical protein